MIFTRARFWSLYTTRYSLSHFFPKSARRISLSLLSRGSFNATPMMMRIDKARAFSFCGALFPRENSSHLRIEPNAGTRARYTRFERHRKNDTARKSVPEERADIKRARFMRASFFPIR
jgi:hypothetical protein